MLMLVEFPRCQCLFIPLVTGIASLTRDVRDALLVPVACLFFLNMFCFVFEDYSGTHLCDS